MSKRSSKASYASAISIASSGISLQAAGGNGMQFFSAMLPSLTNPERLISFAPALYARLEKVQGQRKELEGKSDQRVILQKHIAEEQMLMQTLDWVRNIDLESNP